MKRILLVIAGMLLISGCVKYTYRNFDDVNNCELTIWSMREINAGKIRISKSCALTGGADGLKFNDIMMQNIGELIKKMP